MSEKEPNFVLTQATGFVKFLKNNDMFRLTPKELETLALVAEAKTNKEIAQVQCVTKRTVESHVRNILQQTNCRSRCELIVLYLSRQDEFKPRKQGGLSIRSQIAELFIKNKGVLSPAVAASRTGASLRYAENIVLELKRLAKICEF